MIGRFRKQKGNSKWATICIISKLKTLDLHPDFWPLKAKDLRAFNNMKLNVFYCWYITSFLMPSNGHKILKEYYNVWFPSAGIQFNIRIIVQNFRYKRQFEPRHNKTNKMSVRQAKTRISLGIRSVWSESSLCAQWVAKDPMFLHADSGDSDQTGRMPKLIWVFGGRTLILLVLSYRGSFALLSMYFALRIRRSLSI